MSAQVQNGAQPDEIAALLHERFSRLSRQLRHLELPSGITPERLSTLAVVEKDGPISVTALAEREMVRPATMSRMVSALAEEDLVRRRENKSDGRGVLVSVTPKGRRIYRRAHQHRLEQLAEALSSLDKDQLASVRNLAALLENLTSLLNHSKVGLS